MLLYVVETCLVDHGGRAVTVGRARMEYVLTFAHTSHGESFPVRRRPTGNEKPFALARLGENQGIERRTVFATEAFFPSHQ